MLPFLGWTSMPTLRIVALIVLYIEVVVSKTRPTIQRSKEFPDPPSSLPQSATEGDLYWQPTLDFDKDSCYNVAAIGPNGTISEGLEATGSDPSESCRSESDLDNSANVYSRRHCNRGICAYIYDYYFEKDVADASGTHGHRHDWEHIAVWTLEGKARWVCASAHGEFYCRPTSEVLWEDSHAKIVYHKDGESTHAFRFATEDDEPPENHKEEWIRSPLISYNGFPNGFRDKLYEHDFGAAHIALRPDTFEENLQKSLPTPDFEPFLCFGVSESGSPCEYKWVFLRVDDSLSQTPSPVPD